MAFSCASAAFAAEVPTEVALTPVEQLELEETNANTLYSSSGYAGESTFPASGEFNVSSSSEVRISYGFINPNTSGTSLISLTLYKKNFFGWEPMPTMIMLTADQNSHVASFGSLASGSYKFELNGHGRLIFGTVTIYSV